MGCSLALALIILLVPAADTSSFGKKLEEIMCGVFWCPEPPAPKLRTAPSEIDLASVHVGIGQKPMGYKFVLFASGAGTANASEELRIRRSAIPLLKTIAGDLQNTLDGLPELDIKTNEDFQSQLPRYSDEYQKRVQNAFDAAAQEFSEKFGPVSRNRQQDAVLAVALRPCVAAGCAIARTQSFASG